MFFGNSDTFRLTSLQRLSFFLYSCQKDLFQSKLSTIITHVKDFMVEQKSLPNRESQVYLILRVLFIRFSHENLLDVLRQLWPMIYADIINIIIGNSNSKEKKHIDVKFAVLKFLEFLLVVNKEFFSAFQWVFFQDTNDLNRLRINESPESLKSNKYFKPVAMEILQGCDYQSLFNDYKSALSFESLSKEPLVLSVSKVNIYIYMHLFIFI